MDLSAATPLRDIITSSGSFKAGGREFDGALGTRWWEAKSGNYWNMIMRDPAKILKFKSDMGERLAIAKKNGATYDLHSNTYIPKEIKEWLKKKGIAYYEW